MSETTEYTPFGKVLIVILVAGFIFAGFAGFKYFKSSKTKIKRRPPKQQAIMVETLEMQPGKYQTSVWAMGVVSAENQVQLKSQVTGKVVSASPRFLQGGVIQKGEILLTIDDAEYRIAEQKARSALDKALSDLEIEQGSQMIAREELKLINMADLGEVEATDLTLRKPQMMMANAAVESARADLETARLNLSRTEIRVPFNALILEKNVSPGSFVTSQSTLATLVDINVYKVTAQVPQDKISALEINETSGSSATIHAKNSTHTWKGRVVRTTGKIAQDSRMAGVIVLIEDPLGKKAGGSGQLFLDDFVELKMAGQILENVFHLSRTFLREEDTVWIYRDGVLDIKKVEIAWKEDGIVYVRSGIAPGDLLIVSDLPVPLNGMSLQRAPGEKP